MLLKITEKIVRENAFEQKIKKPGLSANQPSNNWAPKEDILVLYGARMSSYMFPVVCFTGGRDEHGLKIKTLFFSRHKGPVVRRLISA